MVRNTYQNIVAYLALCFFGILFTVFGTGSSQLSSVWDLLYLSFYGLTGQRFSIISFLYYCIVFLGFAYLFQNHLSIVLNERIYYQLIRYQSLYKWFLNFLKFALGVGFLLLISLLCVTVVAGLIGGKGLTLSLTIVPGISVSLLIYHFFINGLLQLLNYVLISFIVIWIWKKSEYNLITLGVLSVLSLPILNHKLIFPSALNSLGYLSAKELVIFQITVVLLIYLIIEFFLIYYLFKKRGVSF
ncbi:hypothetical protein [Robertmurraya andreesenii]|uniref:ABC transporter permease n=1 Tax=Anoxybacillus andreesenii TaxID=1325932 RepID=A0ABT9V975_9BACL|nr:hypothetical protein [Robertmurraya andreesenii]MDQ0157380.1 hypothetical protein [Robertmurraya andreesenii]